MTANEAAGWLSARDRFLILTHIRPDGDTLGCALALMRSLRKAGKTAYIAPNPGVTETYADYMVDCDPPEDFTPEHVVAVDIATENLLPPEFEVWKGKSELCIDHHPSQEFYAGETVLDAGAAACGEIVYDVCRTLAPLDADIAQALYMAISTDCGCFAYGNTTPRTHRIAADLMEYGDFWKQVNKNCFQTVSQKRIRLEGMLLDSMEFFDDGAIAVGAISQVDMARIGATQGDGEELASFAAQIRGVRTAATLRQLGERTWKLSLRTDGTVNATKATALLGGGGHAQAAGATMEHVTQREARDRTLAAIRQVQRGSD